MVRGLAMLAAGAWLAVAAGAACADVPELEIRTWIGLAAPARTPPPVIAILNRAVNKALADPVLRMWMYNQGLEPIGGSAESFSDTLVHDDAKWKREIERLGIRE